MLLLWQYASAKFVTEGQALKYAVDFFRAAEVPTKSTSVQPSDFKLVCTFPNIETKASADVPALYVFERISGGYVIVSGEDVARPVLGYSIGGRFPVADMPDNMRAFLQWYADIIDYARVLKLESNGPISMAASLDPANSVQLKTASWNQRAPFNNFAPEFDGKKCPIGCMATAISIIMRYHKWPQRGTGVLPSYDYTWAGMTNHIEGFSLGHEYLWDNMPEEKPWDCTEDQAYQMARLCYDVAVMCKMMFGPWGSVAKGYPVQLLTEYFGYDKSMSQYSRDDNSMSAFQWEQIIKDEIDANRPVFYGGEDNLGNGHAFVIDGYNGRYFSFNYGWGETWPSLHGHYFTLTPIEGHEEDLTEWYEWQHMNCRIMPEQGGSFESNIYADSCSSVPYSFELGKDFEYSVSVRDYSVAYDNSFDFCCFLFDQSGNVKEVISDVVQKELPHYNSNITFTCCITRQVLDGDEILLCYRDVKTKAWRTVPHCRRAKTVFSKRPVKELIEIGYTEFPETTNQNRTLEYYIHSYKDLCWELLEDNRVAFNGYSYISGPRYVVTPINEPETDTIKSEFWILPGTYKLRIKNPLTEEEMTINLEL